MKRILALFIVFTMFASFVSPTFAVTKDKTPPIVRTTNPTNNKINFPITQAVTVNFSENIVKGKTFSRIILNGPDGFEINYRVKISKNVLSIKSTTNLINNSKYILKIPVGAIADKSGNSLKKMLTLSFKTVSKPKPSPTPVKVLTVSDIAKKSVGVVYIEVADKSNIVFASGSGFIVDDKIITNYHVIDKAFFAKITTSDGYNYAVTGVYSYDKDEDLAVLETDAIGLPSLKLGDSSMLKLGDNVVAIGSPLGLQNTVSEGIISGFRDEWIQISVPINHGSSGGALFNMKGEVVGITTSGLETTGDLNFAIPINIVKPLLDSSSAISLQQVYNNNYTITYSDGFYEGDILNGKENGQGTKTWINGDIYVGTWVNGVRSGQGTYTWANGNIYTGDFIEGLRGGQGTMAWANGDVYVGEWGNNNINGQGTMTWINGDIYVGTWVNGVRSGQGTYTWANGNIYTGDFIDNNMNGQGTMTWTNGDIYVGEWKDGKEDGQGTYYYANGSRSKGIWVDGKLVTPN